MNNDKVRKSFQNFLKHRRYQLNDLTTGDIGYHNALFCAFREGFNLAEKMRGEEINLFGDPFDNSNTPLECLEVVLSLP